MLINVLFYFRLSLSHNLCNFNSTSITLDVSRLDMSSSKWKSGFAGKVKGSACAETVEWHVRNASSSAARRVHVYIRCMALDVQRCSRRKYWNAWVVVTKKKKKKENPKRYPMLSRVIELAISVEATEKKAKGGRTRICLEMNIGIKSRACFSTCENPRKASLCDEKRCLMNYYYSASAYTEKK